MPRPPSNYTDYRPGDRFADPYPAYSPAERRVDHAIHVLGLGAAALAVPLLLVYAARWHGASVVTAAALVYAASLIAMLGFSAAYHMIDQPSLRRWLRRGDHAAIYAKIAGSYTPLVILHGDGLTLPLLGMLWGAAGLGMVWKLALPGRGDRIAILFYIALGWSVVLVGAPILQGLSPSALWLTLAGGVLYTVGVIFFLWESLPFQNAIWHAMVLAATALVFTAILVELAAAVPLN